MPRCFYQRGAHLIDFREDNVGRSMKLSPESWSQRQREDLPAVTVTRSSEQVGAADPCDLMHDSGSEHSSGIYLREGARIVEPTSADTSFEPAAPSAEKKHASSLVEAHLRAWSMLAVLVLYGVWHTSASGVLLALSPLFLLVRRDPKGAWAMRAAVAWLVIAAVQLVYPSAIASSELRHFVSIAVLAVVLWRLHRAHAEMQELSRRDPLTGLLNRRGFEEAATLELRRALRYSRPLAFAVIDIDRFKEVNDRRGHGFGDLVLQIVAETLGGVRGSDLGVRLGGDEFGVLMPETDQASAELLLNRVQQRVLERTAERGWAVTLSVGVVSLDTLRPEQAQSVEAVLAEADRRMYGMKHSRRPASGPSEHMISGLASG